VHALRAAGEMPDVASLHGSDARSRMKYRADAESLGRGPRVTACAGCGVPIFNDWPYYKRQWADEQKVTGCPKDDSGWHRPRAGWDRRRPK
jgi:hypothetical protein